MPWRRGSERLAALFSHVRPIENPSRLCERVAASRACVTEELNALPILIVDDDEPTQRLLQAVLRRSGYGSDLAANGAQAIARLQTHSYAAVILDVMMPEVGGREVVDFLTASSNPVPVVICSAAGPSALGGFDPTVVKAVIRKPFDVDELAQAVKTVARIR